MINNNKQKNLASVTGDRHNCVLKPIRGSILESPSDFLFLVDEKNTTEGGIG